MRVTLILLYGFLEIVTQGQGLPARVSMEFNTVAWHHLSPSLRQVLQATKAVSGIPADKAFYSPSAQEDFENLPLKFSNGVKIDGLLPGEELDVKQGWIVSYIPRNNIAGMQNRPCSLWNEVSVQLKRGGQSVEYQLMMESEAVEAWRKQWVQHGGQWQDLPGQQA